MKKSDRLEIRIADVADGQKCFGRLADGLAVFVEGPAAVGDRVAATITRIKKNYIEARLAEVLEPAPCRAAPICAHFGTCGGCKWQHITYAEQLRIKRKLVADALAHIGGFEGIAVSETLPAPSPFGYRNKVEFSFGDRRYLLPSEMDAPPDSVAAVSDRGSKPVDFALGFHVAGFFEKVLDIDHCDIATERMNRALVLAKDFAVRRGLPGYSTRSHQGFLRNLVLRESFSTGEFMVYLVTSSFDPALMEEFRAALGDLPTTIVNGITQRLNNVAYAEELHTISGRGAIEERLGPFRFDISPNSFFQTNSAQALCLYEAVGAAAELQPDDSVFDLYSGTGTIAIFMSPRARRIHGFEQEPGAVRNAIENARTNGVANCEFTPMDLRHLAEVEPGRPDVVITDPPRAGMHPDTVKQLALLKPRRIVYVSCNPASLARDGRMLCADGLYRMGAVQPVDLFPQTYHVETVAQFDRVA